MKKILNKLNNKGFIIPPVAVVVILLVGLVVGLVLVRNPQIFKPRANTGNFSVLLDKNSVIIPASGEHQTVTVTGTTGQTNQDLTAVQLWSVKVNEGGSPIAPASQVTNIEGSNCEGGVCSITGIEDYSASDVGHWKYFIKVFYHPPPPPPPPGGGPTPTPTPTEEPTGAQCPDGATTCWKEGTSQKCDVPASQSIGAIRYCDNPSNRGPGSVCREYPDSETDGNGCTAPPSLISTPTPSPTPVACVPDPSNNYCGSGNCASVPGRIYCPDIRDCRWNLEGCPDCSYVRVSCSSTCGYGVYTPRDDSCLSTHPVETRQDSYCGTHDNNPVCPIATPTPEVEGIQSGRAVQGVSTQRSPAVLQASTGIYCSGLPQGSEPECRGGDNGISEILTVTTEEEHGTPTPSPTQPAGGQCPTDTTGLTACWIGAGCNSSNGNAANQACQHNHPEFYQNTAYCDHTDVGPFGDGCNGTLGPTTPPGGGIGTTPTATINVAGGSQGGAGIDSTAYPDQTINFQAHAQSSVALSALRINVTDQQSAITIGQTSCSGATCDVSGSLTWSSLPRQPSGTDRILYYVYVEAETVDGGSCSGRGNSAAGTNDCAPSSDFVTLPSSHLTYYLQVRPTLVTHKYRKDPGLRVTRDQSGSSAFVNCVEDDLHGSYSSFYECAASYPIYCCSSSCGPIQNRFTGINDACWLSAGGNQDLDATFNSCGPRTCAPGGQQYSQGNPAYPAGQTTGGAYQSTTSTYTGGGSTMWECRNGSFVQVTSSTCQLPNFCVVTGGAYGGGQISQCYIDACRNNTPNVQCTSGSCSGTGQTNPHRVWSGGMCIGIPGCGVPECEYGQTRPTPTPSPGPPTYECSSSGQACTVVPAGRIGAFTDRGACDTFCRGTPPTQPPSSFPAYAKVANSATGQDCAAVLASSSARRINWPTSGERNFFDIPNEWDLGSSTPGVKYVCAEFFDSSDRPMGGRGPIVQSITLTGTNPTGACDLNTNICTPAANSRFNKFPSGTRFGPNNLEITYGDGNRDTMRCSPTSVNYNSPPNDTQKSTFCSWPQKTQGDADGNGVVNDQDYVINLRGRNGGVLPSNVNPDFNGNGHAGSEDLLIIQYKNSQR